MDESYVKKIRMEASWRAIRLVVDTEILMMLWQTCNIATIPVHS